MSTGRTQLLIVAHRIAACGLATGLGLALAAIGLGIVTGGAAAAPPPVGINGRASRLPAAPQLSIQMSGPLTVAAGGLVTYSIVITREQGPFNGAVVTNVLPVGAVYDSAQTTESWDCGQPIASTITCTRQNRVPELSRITVTVRAPADAVVLVNRVGISATRQSIIYRASATVETEVVVPPSPNIYLPLVLKQYCSPDQYEIEPNNSFSNADLVGPICNGATYHGMFDGEAGTIDLYKMLLKAGEFSATVSTSDTAGVQLVVYYASGAFPVAYASSVNSPGEFVISYSVTVAGPYYLYVYRAPGYPATSQYQLRVRGSAAQ